MNISRVTRFVLLGLCVVILAVVIPVCGYGEHLEANSDTKGQISIPHQDIEKVELLYFHPRFRCLSCNNVEKFAKEVAENEFEQEMEEGKLVFRSLDIDDPENKDLVEELGVTGSSLYVVATDGGKREHQAITDVWLHWNDSARSKEIITAELNRYIKGDDADGTSRPLAGMPVILAAFLLGLLGYKGT